MRHFTAGWLALREPADARARSAGLSSAVAERFAGASEMRILDLAAGTGANVRYLARVFSSARTRRWLMVDNDAALLALSPSETGSADQVETRTIDLASIFDADLNLCGGQDLVTASALLDLVSERWLHALAGRCRDARSVVLFALTYNGQIRCLPGEREDDEIRELVNRHQRIDKGFGPALGPSGSELAARAFAALGFDVHRERSDWSLNEDVRELQTLLVEGWADAAEAIAPERAPVVRDWKARRLAHVAAGRSEIIVGHEDLAAWLP